MHTEKLQLSDIRYNPEHSGFEAKVRIHDQSDIFDYPVRMTAALQADFALIARGLVKKAISAHCAKRPTLRMRRSQAAVQGVHRSVPQIRETSPVLDMLRALAA